MKLKKIIFLLITSALSIMITACGLLPDNGNSDTSTPGDVITANTDYSTGSLSSLVSETLEASSNILKGEVDPDLRVRSYNGLIYVLNNTNQNIQLIDPQENYKTLAQVSTGEYSYPHDIVITGTKGYVALNGSSKLWIVNAATLVKEGEIDLSNYCNLPATNPSVDQLWYDSANQRLFVSIGRLKYVDYLATTDYSSVLVINTSDNTITKEIKLQWDESGTTKFALNPYTKFVYASKDSWDNGDGHDHIFVLCQGLLDSDWSDKKDGGIVAIDLTDLECESGFVVTESYLDNGMSDFDYAAGKFFVAATSSSTSDLFAVQTGDSGKESLLHLTAGYSIPFVKVNSSGLIFAGDRTTSGSGIWMFNSLDNSLENTSVISTGLPPADIAFVE